MNQKHLNDKVSILITAFNQHHEFINTIAAIAVQIEQNPSICVEIIIVDNGSDPRLDTMFDPRQVDAPIRFIWRPPAELNFRPSSAHNIAIRASNGHFILFLDGDCIPGHSYLCDHYGQLKTSTEPVVTLGHRVFIDGGNVLPAMIKERLCDLEHVQEVKSSSNYWLLKDRRLKEFEAFDRHPMPFHCCHGCNLGIRRVDLDPVGGFDEDFDGYWGYEDIEFGYRMWAQGVKFTYLPTAYVYHQEAKEPLVGRCPSDVHRNYTLACRKIPGFRSYRDSLNRAYYDIHCSYDHNEFSLEKEHETTT